MQIDYKRDLNHTYVILQEEKEPDTASYQIRMLLTNAIPGLLDCKIGKMDDKTLFYFTHRIKMKKNHIPGLSYR